ncbi:hypothetical protein GCM10022250_03600 [Flavobacterium chungbukense]|uniref:Uncharacterized protein n=1 Tax=Flavobacterium chungbukense TaxID=877464 RepID=A0ABP7XMJ8_9FLAO
MKHYGALKTGIPFHTKNKRVDLVKDGENKVYYFNYSFIPLRDSEGNIIRRMELNL